MPGFSHDYLHGTDSTNTWTAQQTFTTGINLTAGQLIFPGTQIASADANTLDDYEEGTFTPTIADDTLNGTGEGQVYTLQFGRYTKIGNRVLCDLRVSISDLGTLSTTAELHITGFPFTSNSTTNYRSSAAIGFGGSLNINAGDYISGTILNNVAHMQFRHWDGTSGVSNLFTSELSVGGDVMVSISYEV